MDVERLMRDLTVEQLAEIHIKLSGEIERKKEELRQMVGRRYRDVLDASKTVKRLSEVATEVVEELARTKQVVTTTTEPSAPSQDQRSTRNAATQRFVLLNTILPTLDESYNGLTDVFCLLAAEFLHRSVAVDAAGRAAPADALIHAIGDQLINHRLRLKQKLQADLEELAHWPQLAAHLAGLALLNHTPAADLLDAYLSKRMAKIAETLDSSTLLGIIVQVKETVLAVDRVFGSGQALHRCFKDVTTLGWCPEVLKELVDDQLCMHQRLFAREIHKVNQSYPTEFRPLAQDQVDEKLGVWIQCLCEKSHTAVAQIAQLFERTDDLVDFASAANEVFKADWPSVANTSLLFRQLAGDALIERFGALIALELAHMEKELLERLPRVNCNPPPLFHKRATKFDGLLASGVSQELNHLVQKFFEGLRNLNQRVNKYTQTGLEENVATLRHHLSREVLDFIQRLTERHDVDLRSRADVAQQPLHAADENQRWLKEFRLYLALVQYEPSVFSQCMADDTESAVRANKMLHVAAETALCHLMDYIVDEATQDSELNKFVAACQNPTKWLDYVQNYERIPLNPVGATEKPIRVPPTTTSSSEEGAQKSERENSENLVENESINKENKSLNKENEEKSLTELRETPEAFIEVPTQMSRQLFVLLYGVCRRISQNAFGHLFTRNVSVHVSRRLAADLSALLAGCVAQAPPLTAPLTQLLFDARTLAQMFPATDFVAVVEAVRHKMDIVDWKLLNDPVANSAKSAMLFGQLQVDPPVGSVVAKEGQPQNVVIDVMPRIEGAPRLMAIPRLSKIKEEEKKAKLKAKQAANAKKQTAEKNINLGGFLDYFMKN